MNLSLFERSQVIMDAFEKVFCALQTLSRHIHAELSYYPIWVMQEGAFDNNRDKVVEALIHFAPVAGLSPQETWTCPGVVAGTSKTIALIQAVNHAKDTFREVTQSCKTISKENPTKPVRDILANNGYGAVKLKQVYRHLHYLEYQPTRIAWSKGKAYSNVIITIEQARQALQKVGEGEHIEIQLAKLNQLKSNDKLVKRRCMKPYWIVNITRHGSKKNDTSHQKIATSLPLFYLQETDEEQPTVCLSKKRNQNPTKPRADKQLEELPFLPSISVYRSQ